MSRSKDSAARDLGATDVPEVIEEYRIVRPLGRGAMGQVFLAHDLLLDRPVALKVIAIQDPSGALRDRFFVEARAIARLSHPNVVAIHRVGEVRGRPYLVSELVRGTPLDQLERPMPWRRVRELGVELASGLSAAHRRGVLHRDVKPANAILAEDGHVKLLDFGLAKLFDPGASAPPASTPPGGAQAPSSAPPAGDPDATLSGIRAPRTASPDSVATVSLSPAQPMALGGTVARPGTAPTEPSGTGIVGSPRYMSPEVWRGEPATRRSDLYSLGILLYELLSGSAPHRAASTDELRVLREREDAEPLARVAPEVDARLAAIVDRCLARDPAGRFESADALREALEALGSAGAPGPVPAGSPYRGLGAFGAEHRALFFGRGPDARAVLDRLRGEPFVLVTGDSGVGKSSLCRAAVLPAAAEAPGEASEIIELVPGRRPLDALVAALAGRLGTSEAALADTVQRSPVELGRLLRARPGGIVLFCDQLEELVTLGDPGQVEVVAEALAGIVLPGGRVRLLATARSDFLSRLSGLPGLGPCISPAIHLLGGLGAEGAREAIVRPAAAVGFRFESEPMVETLVDAAVRGGGGLPLAQFALAELWEAREPEAHVIPASALAALGGVAGALARHADAVVARLLPAQRTAARELLCRLVTAEGTRTRRTEAELLGGDLDGSRRAALAALVRGRLVFARQSDDAGSLHEIAHEALLSGWDTLRGWLAHDAETRAARQRLERAAAEWLRLGRAPEALWGRAQLADSSALRLQDLAPGDAEFLDRSRRASRRQRLARLGLVAAAPALAGLALLGAHVRSAQQIDEAVARHLGHVDAASARARELAPRLASLRSRAFERFDAGADDDGEAAWAEATALASVLDAEHARAGRALESALALDPARTSLRERFGDLLLSRALRADEEHEDARRDEVLERLAAYDPGGTRLAVLQAPAHLELLTTPPGARVSLLRFDTRAHPLSLSPLRELGPSPVTDATVPQGSYVLELTLPGHAPVRLPVRTRRGEHLRLVVELPRREAVPDGFVHVPAGRYLSGSADAEALRRNFFHAAPLHEVETGSFLIARHEVTYADWIAFLEAVPPEERARRAPRAATVRGNSLLLSSVGGRWRLVLRPTSREYVALAGEPIVYGGRDRRGSQDWLQFPVSAVSWEDAVAYTAWLDRTGRVPHARLCRPREWERAARGADGRLFPHGNRLAPDDANFDATYGRQPEAFGPDVVGAHPASRSPLGVDDLAGNVMEWIEAPSRDAARYVGGSFYVDDLTARSVNYEPGERTQRNPLVGVRVCADPVR